MSLTIRSRWGHETGELLQPGGAGVEGLGSIDIAGALGVMGQEEGLCVSQGQVDPARIGRQKIHCLGVFDGRSRDQNLGDLPVSSEMAC